MRKKSYDKQCLALAQHFLGDEPKKINTPENESELAQHIQESIESWLDMVKSPPAKLLGQR